MAACLAWRCQPVSVAVWTASQVVHLSQRPFHWWFYRGERRWQLRKVWRAEVEWALAHSPALCFRLFLCPHSSSSSLPIFLRLTAFNSPPLSPTLTSPPPPAPPKRCCDGGQWCAGATRPAASHSPSFPCDPNHLIQKENKQWFAAFQRS